MTEHQKLLLEYAKAYHQMGIIIVPVCPKYNVSNLSNPNIFKAPYRPIEEILSKTQTIQDIENMPWNEAIGLGMALPNQDYMALDIDGCIDLKYISLWAEELSWNEEKDEGSKYPWLIKSGSQAGYHIIVKSEKNSRPEKRYKNRINSDSKGVEVYIPKPLFVREQYPYEDKEDVPNYDMNDLNYINKAQSESEKGKIKQKLSTLTHARLFDKVELIREGFILLPPSRHISGGTYKFVHGFPSERPEIIDEALMYWTMEQRCEMIDRQDLFSGIHKWYVENFSSTYLVLQIACEGKLIATQQTGLSGDQKLITEDETIPRIVQISWLVLNHDNIHVRKGSIVLNHADGNKDHQELARVGLSVEDIEDLGCEPREGLHKLQELFLQHDFRLIGYDLASQIKVLSSNMRFFGLNPDVIPSSEFCIKEKYESALSDLDETLKGQEEMPAADIDEIYEALYGQKPNSIHSSMFDVYLIKKCYQGLRNRSGEIWVPHVVA